MPATGGHWGAEAWILGRVGVQDQLLGRPIFYVYIPTVAFKPDQVEKKSRIETSMLMFLRVLFRFIRVLIKALFSALVCVATRMCVYVCALRMHIPIGNMCSTSLVDGLGDTEPQHPRICWAGTGQFPPGPEDHSIQLPLTQGKASHGTCVLFK